MRRATPYLQVDAGLVRDNVADMSVLARQRGVTLRPHAKTHKCAELGRLQVEAGATGLTVATVSEAEAFSRAGFEDLFVAYPLWVDHAMAARLRDVAARARLRVGVDSAAGARALAAGLPGCEVLVEVDSGHRRTGVAPPDAGVVAASAVRVGLAVVGVFTFPGHGYAPGASAAVAAQEASALRTAVTALSDAGVPVRGVSGGSTPTAADTDGDVLTEMRPGVYVFGDAQQWELGRTTPERIALTCMATVVSHAGGNVVLDAGSKVLGADRAAYSTGYGRLLDHPGARVDMLSEHHAVVAWDSSPAPELGSRLRVVPNHVCTAVNLADDLVLPDGATWRVRARGANT